MLQRLSTAVFISLMYTSLGCVPEALPPLMDDHRHRDYTQERNHTIIPAYQFTCHGRVTGWSACVEPGSDRDRYLIHFQVWRSFNGSCYTLIGLNIPPEPLAPSGHCVNFKVPPGDEIEVMPKDVMGFYTDRYRVRESQLQNPSRGGVQLDSSSQPLISILSAHQEEPTLQVGSRLCRNRNGGRLHLSSSERPVLAAVVDPILPSTTSCIKHSTTVMARDATFRDSIQQPLTSMIKHSTLAVTRRVEDTVLRDDPVELSTTSTIKHSPTATRQQIKDATLSATAAMTRGMKDATLSATIQGIKGAIVSATAIVQGVEDATQSVAHSNSTDIPTPTVQSLHLSSSNQMSPSASIIQEVILSKTSVFTTPIASTPVKTTSLSSTLTDTASTNQQNPQPQTVHPPSVKSVLIGIQSPVVASPSVEVGAPAEKLPTVLIAGLAIAGLFLTAIVVLVIILLLVCLYNPNKEDKTQKDDSDMDYCEAYELNSNALAGNQQYQLKEGMVWNRAYSKCVIAEPPETGDRLHSKVPSPSSSDKLSTVDRERISHPLTDMSFTTSQDTNDYEEVF